MLKLYLNIQAKYKENYNKSRGQMLGIDETPEMTRSKYLKPIISEQEYKEKAKSEQKNITIPSGD